MSTATVGALLRAARAEQGRTLASVAMDAGLSVPYLANLERGRGNPTLGILEGLADALDLPLADLVGDDDGPRGGPLPRGLDEFCRSTRFRREVRWLAASRDREVADMRERLVSALAAAGHAAPAPLDALDWHRLLDALLLVYGERR